MGKRTNSRQVFVSRWNEHVSETNLLRFNLTQDECERLNKAQAELASLIEAAAKDMSQIEKMEDVL
jgi:hypothetical protein